MDWASCIPKHKATISASGRDPSDDRVFAMMTEEMKEVQEQVRLLRAQMKEHEAALSCTLEGREGESAGASALSQSRGRGWQGSVQG